MALFSFNQKKKKKEKNSNRHYYGCGREVVYASEWFFLFNAMVDAKERLRRVATKKKQKKKHIGVGASLSALAVATLVWEAGERGGGGRRPPLF